MRLRSVVKECSNQAIKSPINSYLLRGLPSQYPESRLSFLKLEIFLCTLNK